jgi:hypothetical protein
MEDKMANKDERTLNVKFTKDEDTKHDVFVRIPTIFRMLKKYLLTWIVTAVVVAALIFTGKAVFTSDEHKSLTALVSFTYDGIESGLSPDGTEFDINELKNPAVIEAALTELGKPLDDLESIRQGISFAGIVPSDAIDRITMYNSVLDLATGSSLSAAEAILDTQYYPTQFKVKFNFSSTGYSTDEAVEMLNTILDCYHDYFFDTYGYNEALGNAVTAIDYTEYDYAEAVDVFDTSLQTLKKYVDNLATDDTSRFRSSQTGYTFSDLSQAISTIREMNLDVISSYITINNVTKDKESLLNYYNYRIETLTRSKTIAQETLDAVKESIESYEKDTVMIFGNGTENTDTQYTQASAEYDNLIKQKISAQEDLSTTTQKINYYNQRINGLKSKSACTDANIEKVETDLAAISDKITELIDSVNTTADEYYETVSLANAYNILVPASGSSVSVIKNSISDAKLPVAVIEVLLFLVYFCVSFVFAVIEDNRKKAIETVEESTDTEENSDENK